MSSHGAAGSRGRLLDLFCGAGGAAMGYHRAGFDVTGVDIQPMPRYPFTFVQADALEYVRAHGHEFDVIHASPPCQDYSVMRNATGIRRERLIDDVRAAVIATGKPSVIENVEGADLRGCVTTLCGTMFGLRARRHRLFELNPPLLVLVPPCNCRNGVRDGRLIGQMLSGKVAPGRTPRHGYTESQRREAIGVPWMTTMEARQAVPPAYTEFIGWRLYHYEDLAQNEPKCWACGNEAYEFCGPCNEHPSECQCSDLLDPAPTGPAAAEGRRR
jgi:DNA (cytosine-5)-methyltransferase 1